MAGRGLQSFKQLKREQRQKEKHQERFAKRLQSKRKKPAPLPASPASPGSKTE
jgi:hypothetical protein